MKTYKEVKRKVEDRVYCDVCGTNCTVEQLGSEYASIEAMWGYGSLRDGEKFDIHICQNCFEELLDWMKSRRKNHLGCFKYPHDQDPLDGEIYTFI